MSRKAPPSKSLSPSVRGPASPVRTEPGAETLPAAPPSVARRAGRNADDPVSLGLRKLWEHVEKEPVPDSMLALLDAIDAARNPDGQNDDEANSPPPAAGDGA